MKTKLKRELNKKIRNSLGNYKVSDFKDHEIESYNNIAMKLAETNDAGLKIYADAQEIYDKAFEKSNVFAEIIANPVDYLKNSSWSDEKLSDIYEKNKALKEKELNAKEEYEKALSTKTNVEQAKKDYEEAEIAYNASTNAIKQFVKDSYGAKLEENMTITADAEIYMKIDKKINGKAEIDRDTVGNALDALTEAYKSYHDNHSGFGRFFRWLPGTSAHKDYKDFCELRDTFKNLAGNVVNMKDVNAYLDEKIDIDEFNNRLVDKLNNSEYSPEMSIKKISKPLEDCSNDLTNDPDPENKLELNPENVKDDDEINMEENVL